MSAVIELHDVVKEYPGNPPVKVLPGINFVVERGELVAIVGPSGSGKSTLLNLIGTLDRPTSGRVVLDGHDVAGLDDAELSGLRGNLIGFVFQQFFLQQGVPALDNVADGLLYRGIPGRRRRERAAHALERVGLGHRMDHPSENLSGGERQRVAIARALVGDPAVVLADEPTGNLDSRSSEAIITLLHDPHDQGSTIVVITHDLEIAGHLPRRIYIRDGRIERDERGMRGVHDLDGVPA